MELCSAGSLADRLARDGVLSVEEAASVLGKIAGALDAAHRRGVLHCDVKPANIMTTDFGEPALGDFGIARLTTGWTRASTAGGYTLDHAPPELLNGAPASTAGDVYALGSSIWQLLAGRPPFSRAGDTNMGAAISRILSQPPPPLPRTDVPFALQTLLVTMMDKDPRQRPADLDAVAAEAVAISRGTVGPGVLVTPTDPLVDEPATTADDDFALTRHRAATPAPPPPPRQAGGRRRRLWIAGLATALVVLAGSGVGVWRLTGSDGSDNATAPAKIAAPAESVGVPADEPPTAPAPSDAPPAPPAPPPAPAAARPVAPDTSPGEPTASPEPEAPVAPSARTSSGSHTLKQEEGGDCKQSDMPEIKGTITMTVQPDGAVEGSMTGKGSGTKEVACAGATGTLNWDRDYSVSFSGRVENGELTAAGTMRNTNRGVVTNCVSGGQPFECPALMDAGTRNLEVTMDGVYDQDDGSGLGSVKVDGMTLPTSGTWTVR